MLHEGLPRLKDGPEGAPAGVSAAVQMGGITYYVVGEARAKEFREVYALVPGAHPVGLTGQDPLGLAPLKPITNPYDLLPAPSGGLLVSDAGANAVWRVTLAGGIHPYARLDPQTHATADGSAQVEAVPTGIALGPVAARRLGYDAVPVALVDLSQEQARLLNVALNKIAGTWDQELLARLLKDLSVMPEVDLSLSGFSEDELQKLLKSLDARDKRDKIEDFNLEDALATAEAAPVTQPGDLWLLGDHRLLCGDATNEEDVARLLGGETAALLATDPPYLVDYRGGNHPAAKSRKSRPERDQHWDDYADPEASVTFYQTFLQLGLAHCVPNPPVYQWHAHRRQALVEQAWVAAGEVG